MGAITKTNINIDTWVVSEVIQINWDEAGSPTNTWDNFHSDYYYVRYLDHEFNIVVESPPTHILWDYAVLLTIAFPADSTLSSKGKKKRKKTIKLIFMINDIEEIFEKEKNNQVKIDFKNKVENQLSEQLGQKVILENVQIIHR